MGCWYGEVRVRQFLVRVIFSCVLFQYGLRALKDMSVLASITLMKKR